MKQSLLLFIYRALAVPFFLIFILPIAALLNKKFREGLLLRFKKIKNKSQPLHQPIWIHCSSGEFEYAKSVIRKIKNKNKSIPILVTYFSPSYKKQIEAFDGVDESVILPLDLPGPLNSFIKKYCPRALLIARSELWPELINQCHKQNVKTLLFSHTKNQLSFVERFFLIDLYKKITNVFVVSEADRQSLASHISTVQVGGDTRYDQVSYRLKEKNKNLTPELTSLITSQKFFLAGSTWPEDEDILLPSFSKLIAEQSILNLKLIIAPHEVHSEHILALQKKLDSCGLKHSTLKDFQGWSNAQVLIIDRIGLLAELYHYCQFAFIGGSFKKKVHSVMEALGAKKIVLIGPYFINNREAIEFSKITISANLNAVNATTNQSDLTQLLKTCSQLSTNELQQFGNIINTEFLNKTGATQKVIDWLENSGAFK